MYFQKYNIFTRATVEGFFFRVEKVKLFLLSFRQTTLKLIVFYIVVGFCFDEQ